MHPDLLLSNRRWGADVCGMDRRLLPLPYIEALERVLIEMGEKIGGVGTGAGTQQHALAAASISTSDGGVTNLSDDHQTTPVPVPGPAATQSTSDTAIIKTTSETIPYTETPVCPDCGCHFCYCIPGGKGEWGDNLPSAAAFDRHIPLPDALTAVDMAAHTHTLLSAMYNTIASLPSRYPPPPTPLALVS